MTRPFRFVAPVLRPASITRSRLLRILHERWEHRVTLIVGGAGLGKTTLLAQALAENRLAPRGEDVWLGIEPSDAVDAAKLSDDLLVALGAARRPGGVAAETVADAVWQHSPTPVCVVLDDVHLLVPASPGHDLLTGLVASLPANGHLVLASRREPSLPLARLATSGDLQRLTDAQLRFDDAELQEVAEARDIDPAALADTGGWPAIAELTASAGRALAADYLWQEVIEPLGQDRRRVLATIVDLGGGDDALVSAALDEPITLAAALDGVPLIATTDAGWYEPHPLWHPMARLRLATPERLAARRRAVHHHIVSARFEEAFALVADDELWDEAPAVVRASCVFLTRHPTADQLARWVARSPEEVTATASGKLAIGVLAELTDPDRAAGPLLEAIAGFRALDDVDGELGAITHLGRVGWWLQDLDMLADLYERVLTLERLGHPVAEALAAVGRALFADLSGDDAAILEALADVPRGQLGPAWDPAIDWLRAAAHYGLGDPDATTAITGPMIPDLVDPIFRVTVEALNWGAEWQQGRLETEIDRLAARLDATAATGVVHNVTLGAADLSRSFSQLGELDQARVYLEREEGEAPDERPVAAVRGLLAKASLLVAEGDEKTAAARLRDAIARFGLDQSSGRRAWRDALCLTYVLVPEARATWDTAPLAGCWAHAHELSAAVVAVRDGRSGDRLADVDVSDVSAVRARLHHRFAAELAVGLHAAGRPEGAALLDALGATGRATVRELATRAGRAQPRAARGLLAAVPATPPVTVEVGVLGTLILRRGGQSIDEPALRRERVRALLAYLLANRTTTRAEVAVALWPDFDDRAGANNLRVTITHLLRALEPWRSDGDPSYFLRADGQQLRLVTEPSLAVDVDEFDRQLRIADTARRNGVPSVALDAYLAATGLWRGDLYADVADAEWLELDRERVRTRQIAALQRAAQLLLGRGDLEAAGDVARRALELDPWSEAAHGVLIGAALESGDRSGARRALERCHEALADIGVDPSEDTRRLARRIQTG